MNKPHVHKDVMIAYANGAQVQFKSKGSGLWKNATHPSFFDDMEYRIKPEREYPVTSLNEQEMEYMFWEANKNCLPFALKQVANAAIKKHIIDTEGK